MRKVLSVAAAVAMLVLGWGAQASTPARKKKAAGKSAAAKTAAPRKKTATAKKSGPRKAVSARKTTASRRRGRKAPAHRATWRNRQMAPTPERYRQIQDALVAKGYLKAEDADGAWNQASIDALKKFQANQNLDASGKINSLSLIALGLGPKPKP